MGILDTPGYSRAASDARFASFAKQKAGSLVGRIGGVREPIPPTTDDTATVTHNTSAQFTGQVISAQSSLLTKLSSAGSWVSGSSRLQVTNVHALAFYTSESDFEIQWFNGQSTNYIWIWVDGAPTTSAPVSTALTPSGTYYTRLTFTGTKRRKVEFWAQGNDGWIAWRGGVAGVVEPLPPAPAVAMVGDSFFAGSDTTYCPAQLTAACIIGRALAVDFHVQSIGGTSYASASNTFGGTARVAAVAAIPNLSLIILSGSVNDDGKAAGVVQAAATAAYAAYAVACPGVPIIVFGPQPSNHTDTVSAARQLTIAETKAAALAAPNVIGFVDLVGDADALPAAFSSGTTYATGDRVTYIGSVWEAQHGASTIPGSQHTPGLSARWVLLTYLYTGTGKIGSTAGNGTRDTILYSDGVHPVAAGGYALGLRQASDAFRILSTYAST